MLSRMYQNMYTILQKLFDNSESDKRMPGIFAVAALIYALIA